MASLDEHCAKWHTILDVQKSRQEQIGAAPSPAAGQAEGFDLLKHMRTCLQEFCKVNNTPPQRIIFYRDGVAHNQFDIVMTQEIAAISRVLDEMGIAGSCELIFVVSPGTNPNASPSPSPNAELHPSLSSWSAPALTLMLTLALALTLTLTLSSSSWWSRRSNPDPHP